MKQLGQVEASEAELWQLAFFLALGLSVLPSTTSEQLGEVHFRVATPGQELLCYALDFSVVLKNVGSKKLLLQFI